MRTLCFRMALLSMLLVARCASAWELLPSSASPASSASAVYEFTNATGAIVQCNWRPDIDIDQGPVAHRSECIWLDASGQPANSIPGLRQVLGNGTMVLAPYRGDAHRPDVHSTEYRCLVPAGSGANSFSVSLPIIVRSVVIGAAQVYASDAYALPGNSAVLTCLVLPSDHAWAVDVTHWTVASSPATTGHLVDSHQPAQGGSKYAMIDGHLHVADVTVEDARMSYRCHARHRLVSGAGRAVSSPPARIVMKGIVDDQSHPFQQPLDDLPDGGTAPLPPAGPPRLVAPARRVVHVKLGQDLVYLTCRIVAHPPAKIRWFKVNPANGAAVALANDGSVRRIALSGDWLQFRHVSADDAGRYRCQASNAHGQVEAEFQLDVVGRLIVTLEPRRQVVGVDEPVEWTCNVSGLLNGQSAPVVRWTRNGADIAPDSSRFYLPQPNVLRINQAAASDAGVYQCLARMPTLANEEVQAGGELLVRDSPPRLASVFSEQTLHPGRPVFMHCFATGSPAPSVVWTVDSLPFTYTSGRASVSRQTDDKLHRTFLNITSAEVEDGGLYCCTLQESFDMRSPNNQQQHCARLNVYGPVSVRWASNRTAVAGQDYALHCPYSGYPIVGVSWYRYSQVIRESDKYKMSANGTLRISNADPVSDSGEYTCIVKGSASSTAKRALYLDVIRPPVIEPFSFPVQVQDGGRAQVTCAISAGDLPIEVTWLRDGRPIGNQLNVEVQTGEFHSLLIFKKLRGEHSGVYTCTARNLAATASRAATLLVQVPPRWMIEPQDVFPLENHSIRIPCRVHAVPVPSVLWYRVDGPNHQMVHPTNNIVLHSDGSIQFNRITKSDEGFLQCRATNNIGQPLSKTVRISVNAGARVRIQTSGSILPTGSDALLRCEVSGDPPLTVHWKRYDQLISSIDRYQLSMTSPVNKKRTLDLNISRIEAEDAGVYICQAANAYGSDAADIQLVVQELPKAPGKLQLTLVNSRSAEVQWLDDEVDPLLHYRVQLVRPGTGWSFNYSVEAGRSLVTLLHLHPFTSYQVLVYAINSAGVGPASVPLEFQTLEEAPSGAPRHVLAEAKSSRSLLVSWLPPQEDSWNGRLVTFSVSCVESGTSRVSQRSLPFAPSRPVRRVQVLVDGLRPASAYTVTVRAWNRMGTGPESEPVSLGTPEAAPSAAPVNVQCSAQSSDAIHVSWTHPVPTELHGHLLGFRIVYKMHQPSASAPNEALLSASKRVGNARESVLYGLHAFQNYSIQVSAVNRAGNGPLSVPVVCQTEETAPNVVQEIKAASVSGSSIFVVWRKPEPSSGRISHYVVMVKDGKTAETRKFIHQSNRNLTFHVGNLVEGRPYEVSVTAAGRMGESSPSRSVTIVPSAKSGAKVLEFSRSVHVDEEQTDCVLACPVATADGQQQHVERSWTFNGQPLAGANPALNYREGRDGSLHLSRVDRSAEGDYTCTVRNLHGRDSLVYTVHVLRAPAAPQLSVTPTSSASIRISWSKTASHVVEYIVIYRRLASNAESIAQEKVIDASEDGTLLDGLLCGTQYEVQIQARNAAGFGPKSAAIRAMTRGSGPTLPEVSTLFGTTSSLPGTLYVHLDHWPTGGCRIAYVTLERKGPVRLLADGADSWNALASSVNPDDQPMLKISDFIADETYHLRLTAVSDSGVQIAAYLVRRTTNKNDQTGSHFDVQPMTLSSSSLAGPGNGYESLIVIASMSISGVMLAFSIGAIGYVFHKRKQYRASSSTKSEYSLRTVAEQLDNNGAEPAGQQVHGRSRINGAAAAAAGSTYSLRKHVDPADDADDDDITPYATFTLKPICGMDTVRSLMSVPTVRAPDSHSSDSIEADVYGHQHPTLPCMTMTSNGQFGGQHQPHAYRHLNRSPVPPYRSSSDAAASGIVYGDASYSSKSAMASPPAHRWNNNKKQRNQRTGEAGRPAAASHFSEFRYIGGDDANKFRF